MTRYILFLAVAVVGFTVAQDYNFESSGPRRPAPARIQPGFSGSVDTKPTPVPILKQINRHNEDGSYTYGYEGADGSFKIETKLNNGEVKGKYGYVDGSGKLRVVEYGANKYGFQPAGEGITVAPPTLVDETTGKDALANNAADFEDNYYQPEPQPAPVRATVARPRPKPQPKYQDYSTPSQSAPVPPRPLSIPGAVPSGVVYSERPQARPAPQSFSSSPSRGYSAPAPSQPRFTSQFSNSGPLSFDEPAPVHQQLDDFTSFSAPDPSPRFSSSPSFSRPAPPQQPIHFAEPPIQQRPSTRSSGGSILDLLAKDYALPAGGAAPLHDITFGSYSI